MSVKQCLNSCSGSPTDSTNYRKCVSNFFFGPLLTHREAAAKHIPCDFRSLKISSVSSYSFILYPCLSSTEPLLQQKVSDQLSGFT